ncbi:hypothetical protein [Sphingomonas prati]|uniref:Uncharacterized protein n=1 Tax=Sphingomonas prati TaxID=1843237 RepID=A0A7W9BV21_9SPHN|nr:hypothetical protein [Sphingomonas prati]MBB5730647.1 hypothetical protein [Sphingomonas prati]GGE96300.1 hypothetical protein GCM10011404_31800 [Sphingomonas prati]
MIILTALALAATSVPQDMVPKSPAEAIAIANAHPERGTTGVFAMNVAAAERRPNALYLNSTSDYRSPDNVTFHLTPAAAKSLEKRLGAKPETMLIGKRVTVRGQIRNVPIANTVSGRPHSMNRYQHSVLVREASQVTVQ